MGKAATKPKPSSPAVRELRSFPVQKSEMRENDDGTWTFEGYAAIFNIPSEGLPFRERVMPGAFTETLASDPDVRLLFNHDPDSVMARTAAGTLELAEDDVGLRVLAPKLDPTDPDVQRLVAKNRAGSVNQMSFAFWVKPGGDEWVNVDGVLERHLLALDLDDGDVSPVTYPAYPATTAQIRSQAGLGAASHLVGYHRRQLSAGKMPTDEAPLKRALQAIGIALRTDAALEERELNGWTLTDLYPLLYDALDQLLGTCSDDPYYYWYWIKAVSDEWFVYVDERPTAEAAGMFQVPYTVDADGALKLGEAQRVIEKTTFLPAPTVEEPEDEDPPNPVDDATTSADEDADEEIDDEDRGSSDTPANLLSVKDARLRNQAQLSRQGARR